MNEQEYRENEAEYLKKIAEAMNPTKKGFPYIYINDNKCFIFKRGEFNPEDSAEQQWELLQWVGNQQIGRGMECTIVDILGKKKAPLALILAALELIE